MAYTFETRCSKCREDICFEIDGEDINQTLNLECPLCGNNFERKVWAEYVHYDSKENNQNELTHAKNPALAGMLSFFIIELLLIKINPN